MASTDPSKPAESQDKSGGAPPPEQAPKPADTDKKPSYAAPLGVGAAQSRRKPPVSPFALVVKADNTVKRSALIGVPPNQRVEILDAPARLNAILHTAAGYDLNDLVRRGICQWCDSEGKLLTEAHIKAALAGEYRPGEDGIGSLIAPGLEMAYGDPTD